MRSVDYLLWADCECMMVTLYFVMVADMSSVIIVSLVRCSCLPRVATPDFMCMLDLMLTPGLYANLAQIPMWT